MKILAVTLVVFGSTGSPAQPYDEAAKKLGEAMVVYTGLDKDIDKYVRSKVSPEAVKIIEQWGTLGTLVTQQRLELKWNW